MVLVGLECGEPTGDPGARAVEQRSVVAFDHRNAGAHNLRELERADACG
jgi:hypothetical protein